MAAPPPPQHEAGAVNVMCAQTGDVLYESNQHTHHYPASLVKVMTALLVLENVDDLTQTLTMSERAATLPSYAASLSLRAGDQMTIWEALHGILLPSANEVANALAEFVAGDIDSFIEMMNQRAHQLGAVNTNYVNACGLPGDGQHITAYDMSLIMRQAITFPEFVQIINTEYFNFPPSQRYPNGRIIRNTNRLVRGDDPLYSQWVIGGKTGWIIAARNTLSTYSVQENRSLIVTVLFTEDRAATFYDTITLLSYGFTLLGEVPLPLIMLEREYESPTQPQTGYTYLPSKGEEPVYNEETPATPPLSSLPVESLAAHTKTLITVLVTIVAASAVGVIFLQLKRF